MSEGQCSGWQVQQRLTLMTRRYDFGSYAQTRLFLDELAQLSDRAGYFPDLSFARTYVSVSVTSRGETLGSADYAFAEQVDALVRPPAQRAIA